MAAKVPDFPVIGRRLLSARRVPMAQAWPLAGAVWVLMGFNTQNFNHVSKQPMQKVTK